MLDPGVIHLRKSCQSNSRCRQLLPKANLATRTTARRYLTGGHVNDKFVACNHSSIRSGFLLGLSNVPGGLGFELLAPKKIAVGYYVPIGNSFRIEDDWTTDRPFEGDGVVRERISNEPRTLKTQSRWPSIDLRTLWIGTTTLPTRRANNKLRADPLGAGDVHRFFQGSIAWGSLIRAFSKRETVASY